MPTESILVVSTNNKVSDIMPKNSLLNDDQAEPDPRSRYGFFKRIMTTYDRKFVWLLALLYTNGGFKALFLTVAQEMFKTQYHQGPDQLQITLAYILFPWNFKIFYGIISDTMAIPGTSKAKNKGYLIFFSVVQLIALLFISFKDYESSDSLLFLLIIVSFSGAFLDVVVDGVSCIQQRRDLKYGSQDLNTWAWGFQGLGAIFSAGQGGYIAEHSKARYAFIAYAVIALIGLIYSIVLDKEIEDNEDESENGEEPGV